MENMAGNLLPAIFYCIIIIVVKMNVFGGK